MQKTEYAPNPNCITCGGSGFVYANVAHDHDMYGRAVPCRAKGCLKENFDNRFILKLKRDKEIGEILSFVTWIDHPKSRNCLKAAKEFASGKLILLLLYGGVGNGKTRLLRSIQHELRGKKQVYYRDAPEFLDGYKKLIGAEDGSADAYLDSAMNAEVLILDDIGKGHETEFEMAKVERIVSYRYNQYLPTALATNKDITQFPDWLQSRFKDSMASRAVLNSDIDRR